MFNSQSAASFTKHGVECAKMRGQCCLAKWPRPVEQRWIKNEESGDLVCLLGRRGPRRVVAKAQVAPKPNEMMC